MESILREAQNMLIFLFIFAQNQSFLKEVIASKQGNRHRYRLGDVKTCLFELLSSLVCLKYSAL